MYTNSLVLYRFSPAFTGKRKILPVKSSTFPVWPEPQERLRTPDVHVRLIERVFPRWSRPTVLSRSARSFTSGSVSLHVNRDSRQSIIIIENDFYGNFVGQMSNLYFLPVRITVNVSSSSGSVCAMTSYESLYIRLGYLSCHDIRNVYALGAVREQSIIGAEFKKILIRPNK